MTESRVVSSSMMRLCTPSGGEDFVPYEEVVVAYLVLGAEDFSVDFEALHHGVARAGLVVEVVAAYVEDGGLVVAYAAEEFFVHLVPSVCPFCLPVVVQLIGPIDF